MAGPVCEAAASPVSTKMPVPMMAPTPKVTRLTGPSTRLRLCSPAWPASAFSCSMGLVANIDIQGFSVWPNQAWLAEPAHYTRRNSGPCRPHRSRTEQSDVRLNATHRVPAGEQIADHGHRDGARSAHFGDALQSDSADRHDR